MTDGLRPRRVVVILVMFALVLAMVLMALPGCGVLRFVGRLADLAPASAPDVAPHSTGVTAPVQAFPWSVLFGFGALGLVACGAAYLNPVSRPFVGVIGAGFVAAATFVIVRAYMWQLLIGALVIAVLTCGVMWLRRSRMLRDVVTAIEDEKQADPAFAAAFKAKLTGKLPDATTAVVDRLRDNV